MGSKRRAAKVKKIQGQVKEAVEPSRATAVGAGGRAAASRKGAPRPGEWLARAVGR